jgi:uncharacterized protein (TIGR03435 family)
MRHSRRVVGILVIAFGVGASRGQNVTSSSAKPKVYEVVSIKPSKESAMGGTMGLSDGFRDTSITFSMLVKGAYDIDNENQVVGMPSWANKDLYDIDTRVDTETADLWKNLSIKERWKQEQPMLQALLADRCKLKVHFETKELPTYDLVIAKRGLKMQEAKRDEKADDLFSSGRLTAHAMAIESIVWGLSADAGRRIVDKTGLGDKRFNFDLQWAPDNRMGADSGPSLFTALEEQLGLKLVPSKSPGKVLVIDHIEKPSPN